MVNYIVLFLVSACLVGGCSKQKRDPNLPIQFCGQIIKTTATEVLCYKKEFSDISDLQYLPLLEVALLDGMSVSDVSPLKNATKLKTLSLMHSQVTDLTPIQHLPHVSVLNLIGTPLSDLKPVAKMPGLKHLELVHTKVSDIGPLMNMPQLEFVVLFNTAVTLDQVDQLQIKFPQLEIRFENNERY